MLKQIGLLISSVVVALLLGVGSGWWVINRGGPPPQQNGVWAFDPLVGSRAANRWLRARVARTGLLALDQSEAIYLLATHDSAGRPLSGDAVYRIGGEGLPTRWWSITVYGADFYLVPNPQNRYAYDSTDVVWEEGQFEIWLSAEERPGNWIPVSPDGSFDLLLRMYNPEPGVVDRFGELVLPEIVRVE